MFVFRLKASFVVSGSQDCTVKVWDLPADLSSTGTDVHQLTARATEKAHDKVKIPHSPGGICCGNSPLFARSLKNQNPSAMNGFRFNSRSHGENTSSAFHRRRRKRKTFGCCFRQFLRHSTSQTLLH